MRCVCTAIYVGPHLLLANAQGSPPPTRSGGEDQPLGSGAGPVLNLVINIISLGLDRLRVVTSLLLKPRNEVLLDQQRDVVVVF
jgi:hypothetical protein